MKFDRGDKVQFCDDHGKKRKGAILGFVRDSDPRMWIIVPDKQKPEDSSNWYTVEENKLITTPF